MNNNKNNFFTFIIDACENKNIKLKQWIQFIILFFIIMFCIFLFIIMIHFISNYEHKFYFGMSLLKDIQWSLIISLILTFLLIVIIILLKLLLFLIEVYEKHLKFFKEFLAENFIIKNTEYANWPGLINDIKEFYPSLIFTFNLFSLIIWLRLIRERLPMDLNQTVEFGIQTIIVGVLTIIFFCLTIFYFINIIGKINLNSKLFLYLSKKEEKLYKYALYTFITKHILKGPENSFNIFHNNFDCKSFLVFFQNILIKIFYHKELYYYIFFCVIKLFIAILFLIEVTYLNYIYYFYRLVFLFLIELIFQIILYMTKEHAIRNLDFFHKYMAISTSETGAMFFSFKRDIILRDFPNNNPDEIFNKDQLVKDWRLFQKVYNYEYNFQQYKKKYDKYFDTVYYSLFFISFFIYFLKINNIFY